MTRKEIEMTRKEIEMKQTQFIKEFDVIFMVAYDWKEISSDVINDMKKIARLLNGYLYDDPSYNGSDSYGIILSRNPISKSKLKYWGELDEKLSLTY